MDNFSVSFQKPVSGMECRAFYRASHAFQYVSILENEKQKSKSFFSLKGSISQKKEALEGASFFNESIGIQIEYWYGWNLQRCVQERWFTIRIRERYPRFC